VGLPPECRHRLLHRRALVHALEVIVRLGEFRDVGNFAGVFWPFMRLCFIYALHLYK
jgi:hypothetical protein